MVQPSGVHALSDHERSAADDSQSEEVVRLRSTSKQSAFVARQQHKRSDSGVDATESESAATVGH